MPRRAKTPRFEEFKTLPNTFDYFDRPIKLGSGPHVLELGCGRGEFILELARRHRQVNFVGMDIKSDRMWFGAKQASLQPLGNLIYIRARAESLADIFQPMSLERIWLTFPDPFVKKKQASRRLTHPSFLAIYAGILKPSGTLRLKTDNPELFDFSLEQFAMADAWRILESGHDLHGDKPPEDDWRVITLYEQNFIRSGAKIKYLEAALDQMTSGPSVNVTSAHD